MDNPSIFDELTNRLNKVKRPDSGIHNSGEFIGDNERMEKSDEQVDSGRESDPAEPAESSGVAKRSGILKNFKKMFKIRRKSKTGKIIQHNEGVSSAQYRAVSEPDIMSCSSKEMSNEKDFTSDDDERLDDRKGGSLKDAPSFIRSSLRKLKLRRSKERKPTGMDSPSTSPSSVGVPPTATQRDNVEALQAISPKKSPKKTHSSLSSPGSDITESKSNRFNNSHNVKANDFFLDENIQNKPVAVNVKETIQSYQPIIQSTAAKDKIRIAPRGRKKPTRNRPPTTPTDSSDKKSSLPRISGEDIERKDGMYAGLSKKHAKDVDQKVPEAEISVMQETFDSFITSLESVGMPDTSTPKKSSPFIKHSPKVQLKSDKPEIKQKSRENIENINNSRKSIDDIHSTQKETRRSVEKFQIGYIPLKDERPLSVSLADIIKTSTHVTPLRRTKSFKTSNEQNEKDSRVNYLPNIIVPLKDDSTESRRYGKFRKQRSQTSPDSCEKFEKNDLSKSVEDVSRLNRENSRRSGNSNEPVSTPNFNGPSSNNDRGSLGNTTNMRQSDENVRKSVEHLKKSSSRHSLNEKTFAITSLKHTEDPVIPYGDSINNELPKYSPDKPRRLQKKSKTGSKDDVDTKSKARPQSVTVRSCDANVILSQISPARSYGDIQHLSPVVKKDKQLVNTGRSMSVDTDPISIKVKELSSKVDDTVPEFRQMALKKTGKTEDYFPKEPSGDMVASNDGIEKNHVLASVKTTLKHIETKNVDLINTHSTCNDKIERRRDECTNFESKVLVDKDEQLENPVAVEIKPSVVEVRGVNNKPPEFHRISLRKVEKREDYLEKESEPTSPVDVHADLCHRSEKSNNKADSVEHVGSSRELKGVVPLLSETESQDTREKNKPSVKVKTFPFQSHDVKNIDKVQDNTEKPRPTSLSQTSRMPYFRRSIDIQENPNPHGVPAWIAMARERQREEITENVSEEVVKESNFSSSDVKVESLVKPSELKSKPTPLPKPVSPAPRVDTSQSTSPTTKKPPPVSQRPRFNAKTDLPKDACMVCGKTAYVLERCEVNKKTLHRSCAKCHVCSRTLNVSAIYIKDGKVWCKQHR